MTERSEQKAQPGSAANTSYPLLAMPLWIGVAEAMAYRKSLEQPSERRCQICGENAKPPSRGEYVQCKCCGSFW